MQLFSIDHLGTFFAIAAVSIGWIVALWRVYEAIIIKLNNLGLKVNNNERVITANTTNISGLQLEMQRSIDDRAMLRERSSANHQALEALKEDLSEERTTVISMIYNNDKASAERNALLREQLARLEERLNVEYMVKTVIRNMRVADAKG